MPLRIMRIGFSNPFLAALGGGDRYLFTILREATRIEGADVELYCPRDPDVAGWSAIGLDVDPARVRWLPLGHEEVSQHSAELDLLVALCTDVPVRNRAPHGVAVVQFPFVDRGGPVARARARAGQLTGRGQALDALRSYGRFLTYSAFAQGWTSRRLGVDSVVVAPPVDVPEGPPARDRLPEILAVARFVPGGHAKRQDVLIDAFRALVESGDAGGWTLRLVGTSNDDDAGRAMLDDLRGRAAGLPVRFDVNAPREHLLAHYARSALLWHAAGFGIDPQREPEQLEHFGIGVADGLAHGAVPLVVGAGGPAEIVRDGLDGRHWSTVSELVDATRSLIADPGAASAMRASGYERAKAFATPRFLEAVEHEVFAPAGITEPAR